MTAQRADELFFEALPAGTPEERALALAFKRGERGAYEQIHERYEARVLSVCRRMLGDPDDAQEAAQEAFLRVYQGLPRFNGRYRLGAWIVRITTNVCLDQLRARCRRPSDPAPLEILDLESPLAEDTDPQILFLRHAEGRRVRKVLDSLPPLHRAAIVLRDFEGIPYSDIAETLGITEGQVKALLHRARKGFKRSWAAHMASMLLPAGVFKRWFKPWDLPSNASSNVGAASQAAESALSTSGQFAASAAQAMNACGGALHQCSQFMADKTAPVVAAVAVGAASVGVAVTANDRSEPVSQRSDQSASVSAPVQPSAAFESLGIPKFGVDVPPSKLAEPKPSVDEKTPPVEEPSAAEAPAPPAPAPESTPTPEPSPTETATPPLDPAAENPAPAPPTEPLEPEGFNFNLSVDVDGQASSCCQFESKVIGSTVGVNEQGIQSLDQVLHGTAPVSQGGPYGLRFHQHSEQGSDHSLDFALITAQGSYMYTGSGTLVERSVTEWGGWSYRYGGRYAIFSRPGKEDSLPETGSYTAEVVVSWRQARIVATRISLTEDPGTD
jgi:RNA polymerase sigma-70 factor (ECF subfamily)